jgi:CRISPR-associated endonuclease/helicase Cas3
MSISDVFNDSMEAQSLGKLFCELTGSEPYPYQIATAQKLIEKNSLLLRAPTGAGKTLAALLPFLWAKKEKIRFADRLIYVLPLRALATYLYQDTIDQCNKVFDIKVSTDECTYCENEIAITLQTGEDKNDPFFEGDIIFTTIDQCLSSYINNPVSLPRKLANINAGALMGSLLVLDEFHLLEPDKSFSTSLEMLQRLKPFSQFLIMTATFASETIQTLSQLLNCTTVQPSSQEILSFPSHKNKNRLLRVVNEPMTADHIIMHHSRGRSIVITNTVTRAQQMYEALQNKLYGTETKLLLLHSRFYRDDRRRTEDLLRDWFGKNAVYTDVILVTTQVVEAGMDISADNLHTEIAPANSLVQRAGRCARYAGDRGTGIVWVYELTTDARGRQSTAPYKDTLLRDTLLALQEINSLEKNFDFGCETDLINQVHAEEEQSHISSYKSNEYSLRKRIHEAMDGKNEASHRELIRDVSSVSVIICENPYSLRFSGDKWPAMISVPRSTLFRLTQCFEQASISGENVAWYPLDESNFIDDESDSPFGWQPISSRNDLALVSWLIVIHPSCARYSPDVGLRIGIPGKHGDHTKTTGKGFLSDIFRNIL